MTPQVRRIDSASPIYQEFARLYRAAREIRPSGVDRWNGELLARDDGVWGSTDPRTGTIALSQHRVLPYLTGSRSLTHPARQAQALQTVLHEAYHLRVPVDAPTEPNAFRGYQSKAIDEGLTEYQAANDVAALADRMAYGQLICSGHAYPGAYEATVQLLDYAAYPDGDRDRLAQRALDQPVVMRWDTIADEILRNRLRSVVPPHPDHQQAARATLIKAMTHPTWEDLHHREEIAGRIAGHHTKAALDTAIDQLRQHYGVLAEPLPTAADQRAHEAAREESLIPEAAQQIDPALRAAFEGQVPAAHAPRVAPSLGDGSRRQTYFPRPADRSTRLSTDQATR